MKKGKIIFIVVILIILLALFSLFLSNFYSEKNTGNIISSNSCTLTSARWLTLHAYAGQIVRTYVYGTNCEGSKITFEVFEKDNLFNPDDRVITNPISIIMNSTIAQGYWRAEYQDDRDGGQSPPPEYYFIARVEGTNKYIKSPTVSEYLLRVDSTNNSAY